MFCALNNYLFKYFVILSENIRGTIISAVLWGKVEKIVFYTYLRNKEIF